MKVAVPDDLKEEFENLQARDVALRTETAAYVAAVTVERTRLVRDAGELWQKVQERLGVEPSGVMYQKGFLVPTPQQSPPGGNGQPLPQ